MGVDDPLRHPSHPKTDNQERRCAVSPEERALVDAVDTKRHALIDGETVTPGVNAALWGRALGWREWLRKEGRS